MAKKFLEIKKEILGIEDIRETLKALEKISAANLHNLKITSQKMGDYEKMIKRIFSDVSKEDLSNPLFKKQRAERKLKIILAQEKGFCGQVFNNLLDFFQRNFKKDEDILLIGERAKGLLEERNIKPKYFFHGKKEIPKEEDIRKIKKFVISQFLAGKYQEVLIFWPAFENLAYQVPKETCFLPISKEKFREEMGKKSEMLSLPIFEPSKKEIIDYLIKDYLGIAFYQKVLEAKLSELSSRTLFMEEAAEKAKSLIKNLSLQYFRQRRETITKQITDLYSHRL